jgi:AraC-like DNA-binding protein
MLVENTQVVLLIVFTHLVVAVFLLSIKSGNRLSNNILGCLLLITALDLSNFVFPAFYLAHLNVDMTRANTALFIAPTIYFYIRSVIHNNFQFKRSHLWHTLPFVFASLILIPRYYGVDTEAKLIFYQDLNNKIEIIIIGILAHSQLALYLIASFKVLSKHRKVLVDHVSDPDQLNTTWLLRFLQVYSINFLFVFIRNTIKFTGQESTLSILTSVMLLVTLCLSIWVLFQALRKPELFKGIDSSLETSDALIKQIDNKPQNEIHDNAVKEKIATLREHMTTHKPYLEPTLTIEMLADDIGLTVSDLSFMINRHLNQHFFDLINEYRINDAAMQLSDPELSKKTVLDILYDVGFNSKSSFNTAFKKQMHMTPTQYRQSKTVIA